MKHCIVVTHGVVPLPCLERWRTLKTQKNPHHAPCPPKLNRTAVGLTRASIEQSLRSKQMDCRVKPGNDATARRPTDRGSRDTPAADYFGGMTGTSR